MSQRSRSSKSAGDKVYIMQLEHKLELDLKRQIDKNKLLNSLLSSTKCSSIDEITEPSTKFHLSMNCTSQQQQRSIQQSTML